MSNSAAASENWEYYWRKEIEMEVQYILNKKNPTVLNLS